MKSPILLTLKKNYSSKYTQWISSCAGFKENLHYQRYYKKATSFSGKNYQLYLGNFLSASARKRVRFKNVLKVLQGNYLWEDIANHYEDKGITENQLVERLRESYQERILMGYGV